MRRLGPQLTGGQGATYVSPELARRVQRFCAQVPIRRAVELLRIGEVSLVAARDGGRLRPDTIARILEGLEREEPLLAQRRAG